MWEENPKYQDATFKTTIWIAGIGTALLGLFCFLSGELNPLQNWLSLILLFAGAWLIVAGVVYLAARLLGFKNTPSKPKK